MQRTIRTGIAVMTAALALSACGGGGTTSTSSTTPTTSSGGVATSASSGSASDSSPSAPAEATTESGAPAIDPNAGLVIWADATKTAAIREVADKFSTDNGITVSVQTVPGGDLRSNFITASLAGQGPDLVLGAHDWTGELVQNGVIDPVQLDDKTKALFNPLSIQGVTFNGQTYGVPYAVENIMLVRNTDLAPNAPSSIEEMVATGKQLVSDGKTEEIMVLQVGQNGDCYHMYPFFTSAGGTLFGKTPTGEWDPSVLGLAEPSAAAALTKIGGLASEGALKNSVTGDNALSLFTGKKSAYIITGPWWVGDIKKAGINYDITPIPSFEGGAPARPFVGVQTLYVASKGAHKTAAEEFATNYFTTEDAQLALFNAGGRPPALQSALDKASAEDPDVAKEIAAGADGDILPAFPFTQAVFDPWSKAEGAVVGGADPTSTMTSAATAIQAAIPK